MFYLSASRETIISLLGENHSTISKFLFSLNEFYPDMPPSNEHAYLIWKNDPRERFSLPPVIVVNDYEVKDFLAWASTYFAPYRPFSTYFRVLGWTEFKDFKTNDFTFNYERFEGLVSSIIIGETLSLSPSKISISTLSPILCESTISFPLARFLGLNFSEEKFDENFKRSVELHTLSPFGKRNYQLKAIKKIWDVVSYLINFDRDNLNKNYTPYLFPKKSYSFVNYPETDDLVINLCSELFFEKKINDSTGEKLFGMDYGKYSYLDNRSTAESRVFQLENAIKDGFFNKIHDNLLKDLAFSLLVNYIQPGTLKHIDIIWQNSKEFPSAFLWYGLVSGLSDNGNFINLYEGLGRRLIKELKGEDNILNYPKCDISFNEYNILISDEKPNFNFRKSNPNYLKVEISPCVYAVVKWITEPSKIQPSTDFQHSKENAQNPLDELAYLIKRLEDVRRSIAYKIGNKSTGNITKRKKKNIKPAQGELIK